MLLRVAYPRRTGRREGRLRPSPGRRFPLDGAVVPGLLLLLARDLALHDPLRVLAWRLTHDSRLAEAAGPFAALLPAATGALDRDPLAQALAAVAVLCALGYAALAAFDARPALRAMAIGAATLLLVVGPSAAFVAIGQAAERPYGQDGGVVQLPLAIDKILAGESPYGADYSGTILAKQARASSFWDEWGGNPILRHHAYLPGTHLLMAPFQLLSRAVLGFFDPRLVTLLFYGLAIVLAARVPREAPARLAAAGVAALNPLVYWHQVFGANDVMFVTMLLGVVLLARRERRVPAAALLGLACATKQLAWPFAPFLLLALSGARSFSELLPAAAWKRLLAPIAVLLAVFLAVVAPVAALDFRAFWGDIVVYNVGLPGGDNYPLGGTPGFGFANFLIYFGRVASLRDYFPFSVFYALLIPLGLLLVRSQLRSGRVEWALATGSAALVASLYFSRVVHPNYLIPAAILLPLAVLALRRAPDLALAPLLLLAVAVEISENALLRTTWEQAAAAELPRRLGGLWATLAPRCRASAVERSAGPAVQCRDSGSRARPARGRCAVGRPSPARAAAGQGGRSARAARPGAGRRERPQRPRARAGPRRRPAGRRRRTPLGRAQSVHRAARDRAARTRADDGQLPPGPASRDHSREAAAAAGPRAARAGCEARRPAGPALAAARRDCRAGCPRLTAGRTGAARLAARGVPLAAAARARRVLRLTLRARPGGSRGRLAGAAWREPAARGRPRGPRDSDGSSCALRGSADPAAPRAGRLGRHP